MADKPEPTPRDVEVAREITAKLQRCDKAAAALGQHLGCAEEWEEYTRATVARYREEIEAPLRGDLADWKESAHAKDEIVAEVEAVAARNLVLTEERDYARQSEERLREALRELLIVERVAPSERKGWPTHVERVKAYANARALLAPAGGPDSPPPAAERGTEVPDHECDEVCEATGMGMHILGEARERLGRDAPGFKVKILACTMHHRCIVIQGSNQHYTAHCADAPPPAPVQPANSSGSRPNLNNRSVSESKLNDQPAERAETREQGCGGCRKCDACFSHYVEAKMAGELDPWPASPPPGTTQEER